MTFAKLQKMETGGRFRIDSLNVFGDLADLYVRPRAEVLEAAGIRVLEPHALTDELDACRLGAKQRGWEVVAEFVDAAESATTDDRPQFREMIAAAKQKPPPFDYIVVWKFSRFSRNREDSVLYKRILERNRVRVVSLNEPVDDSPSGRMLEAILESVDEFYSQNLAQDICRGLRKNASMGFRNGGPRPIGYRKRATGCC